MFKCGLKIWSTNKDWFGEIIALFKKGIIDFVEIYLVPDSFSLADFEILKKNNVPITLHAPHTTHNFNLFNLTEKSLDIWQNQVLKTADYLQSQFIVLHAGEGDSLEVFKNQAKKVRDKRVLIENMPKIGFWTEKPAGILLFGYSQKQLEFAKECGFDICFDVCHAVASAAFQKIDAYDFIASCVLALNPRYFHLSGGNIKDEIDRHLNIWEGNFDFSWLKKKLAVIASQAKLDTSRAQLGSPPAGGDIYPAPSGGALDFSERCGIYLVFETPKTGKGLENDVKNIEYFREL